MRRLDYLILGLVFLNGACSALAGQVLPGWLHDVMLSLAGGSVASVAFLRGLGRTPED